MSINPEKDGTTYREEDSVGRMTSQEIFLDRLDTGPDRALILFHRLVNHILRLITLAYNCLCQAQHCLLRNSINKSQFSKCNQSHFLKQQKYKRRTNVFITVYAFETNRKYLWKWSWARRHFFRATALSRKGCPVALCNNNTCLPQEGQSFQYSINTERPQSNDAVTRKKGCMPSRVQ